MTKTHTILQRQYATYNTNNNNNGNNNKKITPTFGISFGLPNQGGGGYPVNPHGPNPFVNPYGGAIGSQGVNLGLVSVNPLVSLQVTKDDYGEKVLKPFVNLHVTPNNFLVHKFEDLFAYKKHLVFNKHKHLHYHKPNHYFPYHHPPHHYHHREPHYLHHKPSYHLEHEPSYYEEQPSIEYAGPHHKPSYHLEHPPVHYDGSHHKPSYHIDYSPSEYTGLSNHYDESNYDSPPYDPHSQSSYFENPHNYGSNFDNYDETYNGRNYENHTDSIDGNSILLQYQQKFENGQNNYGDDSSTLNSNSRGGKSLNLYTTSTSSTSFKFPSNRKKRDVTMTKTDNKVKVKLFDKMQLAFLVIVSKKTKKYGFCSVKHHLGMVLDVPKPVGQDMSAAGSHFVQISQMLDISSVVLDTRRASMDGLRTLCMLMATVNLESTHGKLPF